MNRSVAQLRKFTVHGPKVEIGQADRFYIDVELWTVRYIAVIPEGAPQRLCLVSPLLLSRVDWLHRRIRTRTPRRDLEGGPVIDFERPISRTQEAEYNRHFRLPRYWGGVGLWGDQLLPFLLLRAQGPEPRLRLTAPGPEANCLVSTRELLLAGLYSPEGLVGRIEDLLMDEASWAIRFLVVDTGRKLSPTKLMVDPVWVERHDRRDNALYVGLPQAAMREATAIRKVSPWRC